MNEKQIPVLGHVDGYYKVEIFQDLEKPGYFYCTVNGYRYAGASKRTIQKSLERAIKIVDIRKTVDAKPRPAQNVEISCLMDSFRYAKKKNLFRPF